LSERFKTRANEGVQAVGAGVIRGGSEQTYDCSLAYPGRIVAGEKAADLLVMRPR